MQFAPTQLASSARTPVRPATGTPVRGSRRRASANSGRQLALFGEGTPSLEPVVPTVATALPHELASKHPANAAAAPVSVVPVSVPPVPVPPVARLRVLPVVRPSAVNVVVPLPSATRTAGAAGGAPAAAVAADEEVWQPMTGIQKLMEVAGAGLLMVACVAVAIFW